MPSDSMLAMVKEAASVAGLDWTLIAAICEQESGWNPYALRYEPAFYEHYVVPLGLGPTESHARSFSWGLCQVLGQVARESGFDGHLAELCQPATALRVGCKVFNTKLSHAGGDIRKALLLYNGGAKPEYPTQVLARQEKYATQKSQ